jgi:hypothetical protein
MKTTVSGGTVTQNTGALLATYSYDEFKRETQDVYLKQVRKDGTLPPTDFTSDTFVVIPHTLNRNTTTFRLNGVATSEGAYLPGLTPPLTVRGHPNRVTENAYYTQLLLEMTNPFRADFSVPVFVKELVELPAMFKLLGQTLFSFVGGAYLNYRFGWVTFAQDLKTLQGITLTIEKRVRELESLHKHGGLRRKIKTLGVETYSVSTPDVAIWSVYSATVKATRTSVRQTRVWGTVRWRPVPGMEKDLKKLIAFNEAAKIVLDLEGSIDPLTAWQMLPFSWLADYFTGISSFLGANQGRGLVEPYDICIMRRTISKDSYQVTSASSNVQVSGAGSHTRIVKERDVTTRGNFPVPPTSLLSASQWKVVLALFLSLGEKLR